MRKELNRYKTTARDCVKEMHSPPRTAVMADRVGLTERIAPNLTINDLDGGGP